MRKIIVGNWKMNKTSKEAIKLAIDIEKNMSQVSAEVVVAPPFIYLEAVKNVTKDIKLAAQDCFWEEFGAYTGEISARQLKEYCSYVIVGHSERRKYQNEQNEDIAKKVKAAILAEITPILCVGENLDQRETGKTEEIICEKIEKGLAEISGKDLENIIIAYEPTWSISTTENRKDCSVEDANDAAKLIRKILNGRFGKNNKIKVFFGGNVNSENAEGYLKSNEYNGVLVGEASLRAEDFLKIIKS